MKVDESRRNRRGALGHCMVCWMLVVGVAAGCGGGHAPKAATGAGVTLDGSTPGDAPRAPEAGGGAGRAEDAKPDPTRPAQRISRADRVARDAGAAERRLPSLAPPPKHDAVALAERGVHRVVSQRLVLYSDAPPERLAGLGEAVDEIFEEWVDYFLVDDGPEGSATGGAEIREALAGWKVTGYLMEDAALFGRLGLLPAEVGAFPNARSRVIVERDAVSGAGRHVARMEFWMHDQKDDYYRRHLLLHEATHCFVDSVVGKPDATWYAEGIAELFATHVALGSEGGLGATPRKWRFRALPADNDAVPGWGRIALIQEAVTQGRSLSVAGVRRAPANEFLETEWYAWCWALATFLEGHPRYGERFGRLLSRQGRGGIDEMFEQRYREDVSDMEEEWQVFVANLEYGYDVERAAIGFGEGRLLESGRIAEVTISADRGWQNTGVLIESGRRYQVRTSGRYSLADEPKTWWCEPQGISFRYYEGRPLGRLVGAVHSRAKFAETGASSLLDILDVGDDAVLAADQAGVLYLRVNDAWGELRDNRGQLVVTIEAAR